MRSWDKEALLDYIHMLYRNWKNTDCNYNQIINHTDKLLAENDRLSSLLSKANRVAKVKQEKLNKLQEQHMKLLLQWGKSDNKPLKFKDLKPNMWVWDNQNKLYVQIDEDFNERNGNIILRYYGDSYNSNCERTRFKENRFYRYEVKEDEI